MSGEFEKRIEDALKVSDPEAELIDLVEELKSKGWNQLETYEFF